MVCVFEYFSVDSGGKRWVIERETRQVTNIGDAELPKFVDLERRRRNRQGTFAIFAILALCAPLAGRHDGRSGSSGKQRWYCDAWLWTRQCG